MVRLLFGFQGRINRAQYWTGLLLSGFALAVVFMLMFTMAAGGTNLKDSKALAASFSGLTLGLLAIIFLSAWIGLALQVKRFHDRGKSGWMAAIPAGIGGVTGFIAATMPIALLGLAPIIGLALLGVSVWFLIELGCLPGTHGPNQFGDPPAGGGGIPSSPAPQSPFDAKPQPTSLQTAEAAIERAIAERKLQPSVQRHQPLVAPKPAMAAPGARAGPASFGRRPAR